MSATTYECPIIICGPFETNPDFKGPAGDRVTKAAR